MKSLTLPVLILSVASAHAFADNGLVKTQSHSDVSSTASRLVTLLENKGMTIFATIDHSDAANKIGATLRPTQLVIFGNPKIGSKLMQCQQSIGIDLPQKMLISEDQDGKVWISYNQPHYLAQRHHLSGCDNVLRKVETALNHFAKKAAQTNNP